MCTHVCQPGTHAEEKENTSTDGYSVSIYPPAFGEAHLSFEISSLVGFYFYYLFHVPLIGRTETISLQLGTLEVS